MDRLEKGHFLLEGSVKSLLENKQILVAPTNSKLSDINDVISDKVTTVALGEPNSVPAGEYASEAFSNLGILSAIAEKAVYCKDVTQVITYVEQNEVDAGVVYSTDIINKDSVRIISYLPFDSYKKIIYPVGITKGSKNISAANQFIDFLNSDNAIAIFQQYGFICQN